MRFVICTLDKYNIDIYWILDDIETPLHLLKSETLNYNNCGIILKVHLQEILLLFIYFLKSEFCYLAIYIRTLQRIIGWLNCVKDLKDWWTTIKDLIYAIQIIIFFFIQHFFKANQLYSETNNV